MHKLFIFSDEIITAAAVSLLLKSQSQHYGVTPSNTRSVTIIPQQRKKQQVKSKWFEGRQFIYTLYW